MVAGDHEHSCVFCGSGYWCDLRHEDIIVRDGARCCKVCQARNALAAVELRMVSRNRELAEVAH